MQNNSSSQPVRQSGLAKIYAPVIRYDPSREGEATTVILNADSSHAVGGRSYAVDGAAIFDGRVVSARENLESLEPLIAGGDTLRSIGTSWISRTRNPNALFVVDTSNHESVVAPDPLGGAMIYYYNRNGKYYVSTDVASLCGVLEADGIRTTKSYDFQVERLLIGNSGISDSSYNEIKTLDSFEFIHIKSGNFNIVNLREELLQSDSDSYYELLRKTRQDILENVSAVAGSHSQMKIAHITGGFDSRLVLAAITHAGLKDKFRFFCSGPEKTRDRIIADGLTEQYALKRTTGPGLVPGPALSITERLLGPLFHSGGILTTGPNGREENVDVIAVGGGYGEVYRTVFADRFANADRNDPEAAIRAMLPWSNKDSTYVSEGSWVSLTKSINAKWQSIVDQYESQDFRGDALWIHRRARVHFGQGSMAWSRVGTRIDPVYSLHGFRLAMSTPLLLRSANALGYDLMQSFDPDLVKFEFDKPRFESDDFQKLRRFDGVRSLPQGRSATYEGAPSAPHNTNRVVPSALDPFILTDKNPSASDRAAFVEQANRLGVNFWQAASYTDAQSVLTRMLADKNIRSAAPELNWTYVNDLLKDKPLSRGRIRDIYSVVALISWHTA
ncbi:hypothetical protein [Glutamicibacter ardleyensis]|uniref:hypothetical protein n=1 Tax=Glutamicibacter ardleyensis TaxID=225894 RepID=UPI003FD63EEA